MPKPDKTRLPIGIVLAQGKAAVAQADQYLSRHPTSSVTPVLKSLRDNANQMMEAITQLNGDSK